MKKLIRFSMYIYRKGMKLQDAKQWDTRQKLIPRKKMKHQNIKI